MLRFRLCALALAFYYVAGMDMALPLPPPARVGSLPDLFNWVSHSISFAAWALGMHSDALGNELRERLRTFIMLAEGSERRRNGNDSP